MLWWTCNRAIEFYNTYQYDRLPALAAELVHQRVAVIVIGKPDYAEQTAKSVTATIPVVFIIGGDPVRTGT